MKHKFLLFSLLLFSMLLFGCSTNSLKADIKEIEAVKIAHFNGFSTESKDFIVTFNEVEDKKVFVHAINSAVKLDGIADVTEADYNIHLLSKDDQMEIFHLWLEEDFSDGSIMNVKDSSTLYKLTKKALNNMKDILSKVDLETK